MSAEPGLTPARARELEPDAMLDEQATQESLRIGLSGDPAPCRPMTEPPLSGRDVGAEVAWVAGEARSIAQLPVETRDVPREAAYFRRKARLLEHIAAAAGDPEALGLAERARRRAAELEAP